MKTLQVVLAAPRGPDFDAAGAAAEIAEESRAGEALAWRRAGLEEAHVHALAAGSAAAPGPGAGATAVILDVLRATTTLAVALDRGAAGVIPARSVAEALAHRVAWPEALLCGERYGAVIPGFDLGNSPFEYTRERVAGKMLIFASTNGSQALQLVADAGQRWLAAFVNAGAAIERAAAAADVWLIAAGKLGAPSSEDVACAGWMARALVARGFTPVGEGAAVSLAMAPRDAAAAREAVAGCAHARRLGALGPAFVRDVEFCATLDAIASVHAV